MHTRSLQALTLALGLALSQVASAATIVLNGANGANHDSVGDGWFFVGPSQPPPDGVGDADGQQLAVAYQAGVVELRAMSEFPLAPLAGLTAAEIQSAVLTVTIDDVIGTFGPGTTFDGTASSPIAVYHYPADGNVTVSDFSPAGLSSLGIISPGVITDASLAVSGAAPFTVDVTLAMKNAITASNTAFGVLMGTLDSPTGTSFDNLGVIGAAFPFITVTTVPPPPAPPVFGDLARVCQATIAKEAGKLVMLEAKYLATCFNLVLKDNKDGELEASTTTKCAIQIDTADSLSKMAKAVAKYDTKIGEKCLSVTPTDINSPCDPGASSIAEVGDCVRAQHETAVQSLLRTQYADACAIVSAVGFDDEFPGICTP